MLVLHVGEIVGSINIVPEMSLWEILDWDKWLLDERNLWFSGRFSAWRLWVNELEVLLSSSGANKGEIDSVLHVMVLKNKL